MADSSFDIVSKVDHQEADNALNQARKEVEQRYDFKGTGASIDWSGEPILIKANTEERAKAVLDVFQSKLVKRGISLKSLETGEPVAGSKEFRITSTLKDGISQENAKKIGKIIRDEGPKTVKSQIQGDELRVQSKSRDDLQEVIASSRPPTSTSTCSSSTTADEQAPPAHGPEYPEVGCPRPRHSRDARSARLLIGRVRHVGIRPDPLHLICRAHHRREGGQRLHRAVAQSHGERADAAPVRLLLDEAHRARPSSSPPRSSLFIVIGNTWWQMFTAAGLAILFTQIAMLGHDAAHRQIFRSGRWNDWTTPGHRQPPGGDELRVVAAQAHPAPREPEQGRRRPRHRAARDLVHGRPGRAAARFPLARVGMGDGAPGCLLLPDPAARRPVTARLQRAPGLLA